jgi:hypothetical protein
MIINSAAVPRMIIFTMVDLQRFFLPTEGKYEPAHVDTQIYA